MTSKKKQIEREIARAQDPVIRMQLRALLNKKGRPKEKTIRKVENALDSLLRQSISGLPDRALLVLIFILVTIIMLIIFVILEGRA
ncbi:MAG: hypothetical protein CEE38_11700 [Planctomycetes bacterium B3_Pla]|nr:MAG: hypothetical protein CEE38_11700 [Planctomycetes bacterium B3_Pla]